MTSDKKQETRDKLKVALVHDYIKEYGGAERVLEALHEIWPDAPVYTTVFLPKFLGPHRERFKDWKIKTSLLQFIPFKSKLISPFRIIAPLLFRAFDFSKYDVVIVSATGAYSPNMINNNKQHVTRNTLTHICYSHTPPRYLYGFATAREWKNSWVFRILGELANHFLRLVDFRSAQNVDFFIANSKNVAGRIKKFYRRDAVVIYPPIEITNPKSQIPNKSQNTKYKIHNTEYYLAGGRIARPKNIELIIKTFEKLKVPLKIFGRSFGGLNISISKYPNIQFLGEVSDEEKVELMRNAKAFVFASEDEDFGITPVEAMSVGTPVIAYRSGGVLESVVEGDPSAHSASSGQASSGRYATGLFFDELTIDSLKKAIQQFSHLTIDPADCIARAQKFSKERFKREIKEFLNKTVKVS